MRGWTPSPRPRNGCWTADVWTAKGSRGTVMQMGWVNSKNYGETMKLNYGFMVSGFEEIGQVWNLGNLLICNWRWDSTDYRHCFRLHQLVFTVNAHCQFYPLVSKITFVLESPDIWMIYRDDIWMIYVFLSYVWCSTRDDDLLWRSCVWNVSRNDQLETVGSWNIDQRKKNVTGWWFGTIEFYNFPFSWEFHQLTNSYFSEG